MREISRINVIKLIQRFLIFLTEISKIKIPFLTIEHGVLKTIFIVLALNCDLAKNAVYEQFKTIQLVLCCAVFSSKSSGPPVREEPVYPPRFDGHRLRSHRDDRHLDHVARRPTGRADPITGEGDAFLRCEGANTVRHVTGANRDVSA